MSFIDEIKARAKNQLKSIVLPETEDRRVLEAAAISLKEGIAKIILIGSKEEVLKHASGLDISGAEIIDPFDSDRLEVYIDKLVEIRRAKKLTREKAREILLTNYTTFAVMMVKLGDADGVVSGACHSTTDTLRLTLQILKTAPGSDIVSAFFVMDVHDRSLGADGVFVFADCALKQNPDAGELAAIAGSSARSFEMLTGKKAKVAMLSHSTKGSAKHPDIDKVILATEKAKEMFPDYAVDGELQLDAAIVPEVASIKAPDSPVAGQANVLVFPDLDSGNIGYKLVQRLAKAEAYGPITQGISAPVNDLSRGCLTADIVGVIAITAVQAQNR